MHYDGSVQSCSRRDLPETLAAMLAARGKTRVYVPADIDRSWLPPQPEFVADQGASPAELDASEGVLTGCSAAIAMTGTIVLTHGPGEGRRVLTLVPDYHLVVVFVDQIVETVPEAIARVAESSPAVVTTISGPSATSDIEMTRIKGVHGPRTLDVVLVGGKRVRCPHSDSTCRDRGLEGAAGYLDPCATLRPCGTRQTPGVWSSRFPRDAAQLLAHRS